MKQIVDMGFDPSLYAISFNSFVFPQNLLYLFNVIILLVLVFKINHCNYVEINKSCYRQNR